MNKEYIYYPARQVSKSRNVYEHMMHEYNDLKNDYDALREENKQLKDNRNELKEYIKFNRKISLGLDNKYGVSLCDTLLNKIQELEDK